MDRSAIAKLVDRGFSPLEAYGTLRKLAQVEELEHWARTVPDMEAEEKQGWLSARGRVLEISQKSQTPDDAADMIRGIVEMVPGPQTPRDKGRLRGLNEALDALAKGTYQGTTQPMEQPPGASPTPIPGEAPEGRQDAGLPNPGKSQTPQDFGMGTGRMGSFSREDNELRQKNQQWRNATDEEILSLVTETLPPESSYSKYLGDKDNDFYWIPPGAEVLGDYAEYPSHAHVIRALRKKGFEFDQDSFKGGYYYPDRGMDIVMGAVDLLRDNGRNPLNHVSSSPILGNSQVNKFVINHGQSYFWITGIHHEEIINAIDNASYDKDLDDNMMWGYYDPDLIDSDSTMQVEVLSEKDTPTPEDIAVLKRYFGDQEFLWNDEDLTSLDSRLHLGGGAGLTGTTKDPVPYEDFKAWDKESFDYVPFFFDRPIDSDCKFWIDSEGNPYFWKVENLRPMHMEAAKQLQSKGITPEVPGAYEQSEYDGLIQIFNTEESDLDLLRIALPEIDRVMTTDGIRDLRESVSKIATLQDGQEFYAVVGQEPVILDSEDSWRDAAMDLLETYGEEEFVVGVMRGGTAKVFNTTPPNTEQLQSLRNILPPEISEVQWGNWGSQSVQLPASENPDLTLFPAQNYDSLVINDPREFDGYSEIVTLYRGIVVQKETFEKSFNVDNLRIRWNKMGRHWTDVKEVAERFARRRGSIESMSDTMCSVVFTVEANLEDVYADYNQMLTHNDIISAWEEAGNEPVGPRTEKIPSEFITQIQEDTGKIYDRASEQSSWGNREFEFSITPGSVLNVLAIEVYRDGQLVENIAMNKQVTAFVSKTTQNLTNLPPTFDTRGLFDLKKYVSLKGESVNWDAFRRTSTSPDEDLQSMLEILTEVGVVQNADENTIGGLFRVNSEKLESILSASEDSTNEKTAVLVGLLPNNTSLHDTPQVTDNYAEGILWDEDFELYWDYSPDGAMHGDALAYILDIKQDFASSYDRDKFRGENISDDMFYGYYYVGPREVALNSATDGTPDWIVQRAFDRYPEAMVLKVDYEKYPLRHYPHDYERLGGDPNTPLFFQWREEEKEEEGPVGVDTDDDISEGDTVLLLETVKGLLGTELPEGSTIVVNDVDEILYEKTFYAENDDDVYPLESHQIKKVADLNRVNLSTDPVSGYLNRFYGNDEIVYWWKHEDGEHSDMILQNPDVYDQFLEGNSFKGIANLSEQPIDEMDWTSEFLGEGDYIGYFEDTVSLFSNFDDEAEVPAPLILLKQLAGPAPEVYSVAWFRKFADRSDVEQKADRIYNQGGVEFVVATPDQERQRTLWEFNITSTSGETYALYGDTEVANPGKWIDWFDVACSCFPPGTPVTMADGTVKPIEQIVEGDSVLTHLGNRKKVKHTMSRPYRSQVSKLKRKGFGETITSTPNHKFWVRDEYGNIGWKQAFDIKPGDFLSSVIPRHEPKDVILDMSDYCNIPDMFEDYVQPMSIVEEDFKGEVSAKGVATRTAREFIKSAGKPVWRFVDFDESLAYVGGLYLGDGNARVRTKGSEVTWTFGVEEMDLARTVSFVIEDKFGIVGNIYEKNNKITITCSSEPLAKFFVEEFGGPRNKMISERMMGVQKNVLLKIAEGHYDSDKGVSSNRSLVSQLQQIFLVNGITSSVRFVPAERQVSPLLKSYADERGFVSRAKDSYRVLGKWYRSCSRDGLAVNNKKEKQDQPHNTPFRYFEDGNQWTVVESNNLENYDGIVYNFEVEDDHSYQVYGNNCANCDWGRWNYDRAPEYRHLERMPCSHCLAAEKWLSQNGKNEQDKVIREMESGQGEFRYSPEPERGRRPRPGDVYRQQQTQPAPAPGQPTQPGVPPTPNPQQKGLLAPVPPPTGQPPAPGIFQANPEQQMEEPPPPPEPEIARPIFRNQTLRPRQPLEKESRFEKTSQDFPQYLYHWTSKENLESIAERGIDTSTGGLAEYHSEEPGVNLTLDNQDPNEWWNYDIYYMKDPTCLTIDVSQLDFQKIGPDLNSLLNEDSVGMMMDDELTDDPNVEYNPEVHNWKMSLDRTHNVRYLDIIPPSAIVDVKEYEAPRDWGVSDEEYDYDFENDNVYRP